MAVYVHMFRGSDVTVLVPTIPGREDYLQRALASIKTQQIQPGAVEIVCDEERHGAWWARNQGLKKITSEWVAFLDDDDELLAAHLKVLLRAANKTGADLIFTYAEFVGRPDPLAVWVAGRLIPEPIHVPWSSECELSLRRQGNFIPVTYLVRTALVRQVGGFPQPYTFDAPNSRDCEDYGLLLRLLDAGARFHHVTGVRTWRYHVHGANTGGRGTDRLHELA